MRVCLFEDRSVSTLEPLAFTRPVYELRCGLTTLAAKQWAYFAPCEPGVLVREPLAELQRHQRAGVAVNSLPWMRSAPIVLVNARWLPPVEKLTELCDPCVAMIGDEIAYVVVGPDRMLYCSPDTLDDCLQLWQRILPHQQVGGQMVRHLWDLVDANGAQIERDFQQLPPAPVPESLHVVGPRNRIFVDPTARLDPLVVADTTSGPVVIDRQTVVGAFTRLEGPCYVGPGTQLLGAKIRAGTSLGPQCRIGGEIECSIVLGHSNKYHDGFLGHSYVGEWVNLGAGTNNSDLRNDYGSVTVTVDGQRISTGRTKIGCYLGDHTKSGLGTLLNTGTSAGAFCNLLPTAGYLPKSIPSFCSVWKGQLRDNSELESLFGTARKVMSRRGCALLRAHEDLYRAVHAQTASVREESLSVGEPLRLRRSA